MPIPTPLLFRGAPGSPYTRKMLALLRYRRIPHRLIIGRHQATDGLPQPKVALLPTFFLPNERGELEAVVDSTPLIRRFETQFSGRGVIPTDPVTAFIDYLLEDYADEWLTKAMFHYRWYYPADIERAGDILPRWTAISAPETQMQKSKTFIQQRQIERLYVVGSNDTTAPVIEASYRRFLEIFKRLLEQQPFLLGARPGAADFGAYGQLTQLAHFDPTPMALTLAEAPRVYAWVDITDDLSGLEINENDWLPRDAIKALLGDLLTEVGRVYAPFMRANAETLRRRAAEVTLSIDGKPWVQQPFPYQGKCLQWLREQHAALSNTDRSTVDAILSGTGCEVLFAH
ncbi:MAG: glutathione S-transferase family protein [Proteobacteria bacterium]|nr:glutathione S-transferase family protein [Pseudomonadota bacterium]